MLRKLMLDRNRIAVICLALSVAAFGASLAGAQPTVSPRLTLQASGVQDQDDLAFWLHPTKRDLSTIVTSDKSANKLFVYDLEGKTLQEIAAQKPGNVDVRYGFTLGKESVDVVAFNERKTNKIRVYKVNSSNRRLEQIDDGNIDSGPNYGFALYKHVKTGRLYAFSSSKADDHSKAGTAVKQFELVNSGNGRVSAVGPLREFKMSGTVEGMVADDEEGKVYLAEENGGIWKFDAEPDQPAAGAKVVSPGENGMIGDIEGLAIYYMPNGEGYLIASNQGTSTFRIYDRKSPHKYVGAFAVGGVMNTDGLEVINVSLNAKFPRGVFASHNGRAEPHAVQVVKWDDIASALGLRVDTSYWDPRKGSPAGSAATAVAARASEAPGKAGAAAGAEKDKGLPAATAALVRVGKVDDDEGRFRVEANCSDNVAAGVTPTAKLNDIPVRNGQTVKLELDDKPKVKTKDDVLEVEGPEFRLVVACRDAAGNEQIATAAPRFADKWEVIASELGVSVESLLEEPWKTAANGATASAGPAANASGKAGAAAGAKSGKVLPKATAALVAAGKVEDDEGRFRVRAACTGNADAGVTSFVRLNKIPVGNGQTLKLELDDQIKVKKKRDYLEVKAPEFRLLVACRDAAGNVQTATATPQFVRTAR
ncbi:MAG: phytase [Betaproteobacteria bacterium]|nr:phytase [Betaproteobacteria bacterium]